MAGFNWPALLVAIVSLIFAFYMDPDVSTKGMKFVPPTDLDGTVVEAGSFDRLTFSVHVQGETLHCWLFSPKSPLRDKGPPPVVVAAYGLGVQKDLALVPLATSLTKGGLAVVLFDYRHWGVSGGFPRHLADPLKELDDTQAVLKHIEDTFGLQGRVDPKRIALYGSSLGGGIALATASLLKLEENPLKENVKAVVVTVPFVSGKATQAAAMQRRGFLESFRIVGAVVRDYMLSFMSTELAAYVKVASPAASAGLSAMRLEYPDYDVWAARTPLMGKKAEGAWENKLAARTLYKLSVFQADRFAVDYLDVPSLVLAGSNDTVCPIDPIRQMAKTLSHKADRKKMTLMEFPLSHFDFITPKHYPGVVKTITAFLIEHL